MERAPYWSTQERWMSTNCLLKGFSPPLLPPLFRVTLDELCGGAEEKSLLWFCQCQRLSGKGECADSAFGSLLWEGRAPALGRILRFYP